MRRLGLCLTLLAGCAAPRAAAPATVLRFPSELTPDSALGLARNVLRRAGWPAPPLAGDTLTTDWHATPAGPLRLVVTAAEVRGGASTVVAVRGETREAGRPVGVARGMAAWPEIERIARHTGVRVRYALY